VLLAAYTPWPHVAPTHAVATVFETVRSRCAVFVGVPPSPP
jgi:hypothetical protein